VLPGLVNAVSLNKEEWGEMKNISGGSGFPRSWLPVFQIKSYTLSVMLACMAATPVYAFEFKNEAGDVTGSFDTTVSFGTSVRAASRDPALVSIANGGTSRSPNEDDGNLNYNKDRAFSTVLKASHDLELKYQNFGLFARGAYFYDFVNDGKSELGQEAQNRLGKDARLLDAFVWGNFDVQERPLNVRLGKQVVSWGESTFIGNGINIINPLDVSKLRAPGAELKEGLIPSPMVWVSAGVTDKLTVEGFVLTQWDKTKIDPRGSYFSNNDFLSDDGDKVYLGFGRRNDQHFPLTSPATATGQVWAPRGPDRKASNGGQYGVAFRYLAEGLNNTDFGFYHVNYHSRTPIASGIRGGPTSLATPNFGHTGTASYFAEFPENIRLFGMSFSTGGPAGIALQGEYSYRRNQPLQLASIELLLAALGSANNITGVAAADVPVGTEISGYRRVEMHQLQLTSTKAFGPMFNAEQFVLLGEVGYTYLNLPNGLLFSGPGTFLPAPGSANAAGGSFQQEGYATKSSWGYRLLGRLDFPNAIGAASLSPRIAFSHDVDGVGPTFNQDAKALTLGLGVNLKQNWQADIAYTSFFGGRTYAGTDPGAVPAGQSASYASSANPLKDRDFISASVSYAF